MVDWELNDWKRYKKMGRAFNRWGGSDCYRMLRSVKEGWGSSWAIRLGFSQFLQDKLSLFPVTSKVKNEGYSAEGTNCNKWNRFKSEFDSNNKKNFRFPEKIELNKTLYRSAMSYNTLYSRIYSRMMYILNR
jgi:hypothetical protein